MPGLTPEGTKLVSEIAARHGVSTGAVETLLFALVAGNGTQAQFDHPDLGGMGQWSQGGMTMVGNMFDNALKARVDALCSELAGVLANHPPLIHRPAATGMQSQSQSSGGDSSLFLPGGAGASAWPAELGMPSSTGAQNNLRYAFFPETHRLAIDIAGRMEIFDTGDHRISGVSQQQSGDQSLTFVSQYGLVRLADLPKVDLGAAEPAPETPAPQQAAPAAPAPAPADPEPQPVAAPEPPAAEPHAKEPEPAAPQAKTTETDSDAIIALIRKLADLREGGILTDAEFEAKKQELLSRL
ncbi:SHOCT domain-containing protein [Salipiger abyssi]|uniref:Short C-terminal domain-containing protein n=1 Tax=Salipiger abyssi TaxID=1250539 RepID=A0A1P8UV22_9RHOB|nr:SHOCT domain-containing protein [Salipiger abyssi]APZ53251.1 Short C-terminal domain-containing protein [Salipiger abyssi]